MPDPPDVRLVTISYDADNGLEVDWDGCSVYEAWAYVYHALDLIEAELGGDEE